MRPFLPPHLLEKQKQIALDALWKLDPARADDRDEWLRVGMILHSIDPDDTALLAAWIEWSRQSSKFNPGECETKWAGFREDGGVTIATLVKMSRDDQVSGTAGPGVPASDLLESRALIADESELKPLDAAALVEANSKLKTGKTHAFTIPITKPHVSRSQPPSKQSLDGLVSGYATMLQGSVGHGADFQDGDGRRAREQRYDLPDGSKDVRQFSEDGNGNWIAKGLTTPYLPYHHSELVAADPTQRVYITEGPKKCDKLRALGVIATTTNGGAQASGRTDLTLLGKFSDIVILIDNDDAGRRYGQSVANRIHTFNSSAKVRIVLLPGLAESGDVADFIDVRTGQSSETIRVAIVAAVDATRPVDFNSYKGRPVLQLVSEVIRQIVAWIWTGLIAAGKLTLITGNAGVGKTFFLCDLIAHITTGEPFPGETESRPPASVILIAPEDGVADTLVGRLTAAKADTSKVRVLTGVLSCDPKTGVTTIRPFDLVSGLHVIEDALDQHPDTAAIVIDPVTSVLGNSDSNDAIAVRNAIQPLITLAEKRNVALVCTTHLSKATDRAAIHRTLGSGAFNALARMVVVIVPDKADESLRYVLSVKNNLAKKPPGRSYKLEPSDIPDVPRVVWQANAVYMDADEALAESEGHGRSGNGSDKLKDAIRIHLEDGKPHPRDEIIQQVQLEMPGTITSKTIERTAMALGVVSEKCRFQGKASWRLPPDGALHET